MKMKNSKTSISNLNPGFTGPLQKFDLLHKKLMGNEAVVTSVDTGRHWGSIKKENRPLGWEDFTEAQVREFSDSKHYNIPCDAVDFRRRCPDGELTYYDDLTASQQRLFRTEIYECFPDDRFDVVFSRLCLHIEFDPEYKPLENDENRTDDDLDPREPEYKHKTRKEKKVLKLMQRKIVVTELDKMWAYLDRSAVIMGAINFLTKRLTGFGFFKDKLKIGKDQSLYGRLIELINELIKKLRSK